jgi:hypothetical protein
LTFNKRFCTNKWSHEQRCALRPLVHWLFTKTSDEKRDNPKNAKGLIIKTSDEKRGNHKNIKGLIIKTFDKNRSNPKNAKRLITKTSDGKRDNPKKRTGAHQKRPPRKKKAT